MKRSFTLLAIIVISGSFAQSLDAQESSRSSAPKRWMQQVRQSLFPSNTGKSPYQFPKRRTAVRETVIRRTGQVSAPATKPIPAPTAAPAVRSVVAPTACGDCATNCATSCKGSCASRFWNWLCYRSCPRSTCDSCRACEPSYPPLYTFFLHRCRGCGRAPAPCSPCR